VASDPRDNRFAFGENWASFLSLLDEDRIRAAEESITERLGDLRGKTFLDVGSGSGLFSLAARNLGASVVSFDFDLSSVWCTEELRRRYYPGSSGWDVMQGSVLDQPFLKSLGQFNVVYSWGVLHHTGNLWQALENVASLGRPGSQLFISIYNDQGATSRLWTRVKRRYNSSGRAGRLFLVLGVGGYFQVGNLFDITLRRIKHRPSPQRGRGMDRKHDLVDWVGGYPFEVATPDKVFTFYRERGFQLTGLKTCGGGLGCNEYVLDYPALPSNI
jgi:2-polyprenyl-6-hydroxyphenyl methylase/3-demethylubiquinone-9 3-methyltransferase